MTTIDLIFPENHKVSDLPAFFVELTKGKNVALVDMDDFGKFLIACKDFKEGEISYQEKVISNDVCEFCLKSLSKKQKNRLIAPTAVKKHTAIRNVMLAIATAP